MAAWAVSVFVVVVVVSSAYLRMMTDLWWDVKWFVYIFGVFSKDELHLNS